MDCNGADIIGVALQVRLVIAFTGEQHAKCCGRVHDLAGVCVMNSVPSTSSFVAIHPGQRRCIIRRPTNHPHQPPKSWSHPHKTAEVPPYPGFKEYFVLGTTASKSCTHCRSFTSTEALNASPPLYNGDSACVSSVTTQ
jgi:hypothetical protein